MHDLRAAKILVFAALAMVLVLTTNFSTAAFTSSSTSTATVRAAADWTPPTALLGVVAPLVKATVAVTAIASDADSGLARVAIERRPTGATLWQTVCETTTSPVSCTWSTTGGPDGEYEVQAVATDKAGNGSPEKTPTRVTVDNTAPLVNVVVPAGTLTGSKRFAATASDATSGVATVRLQYAVKDSPAWSELCTPTPAVTGGWSCNVETATLSNGLYDFRAVATDRAGHQTISTAVTNREVKNAGPTVTMSDPGAVLYGTATLAGTAESTVGVRSVEFQYAPAGSSTWTTVGTDAIAPYDVAWNTSPRADGWYDVRAVATDTVGNQTISAPVTRRLVDNAGPSVTLTDPGATLTGTVTLTGVPTSLAGVRSVQFQYLAPGATVWTNVGSADTTSPYSAAWETAVVPNGSYSLRAVVTDVTGRTAEASVTGREVSNVKPLNGADVQTTNKLGGRAGWLEQGDSITFTYANQVDIASVLPGWTAQSKVVLRVRDGKAFGRSDSEDGLDVLVDGAVVSGLGSVNLGTNLYQNNQQATFNATIQVATVTIGGTARTAVTVVLGFPDSVNGSHLQQGQPAQMIWTDGAGRQVLESGEPVDVDF